MKYQITIGIECHVQLATATKLFSTVDNDARDKAPNSCLSPIDYALPGMLPLLNRRAVELSVRAGRALNATINPLSRFDRKHYYYPDSPKGYQITQLYQPIIGAGFLTLPSGERIGIEHAHLEEDAGKLTHFSDYSLVDLNRVGTPLLEIVSLPEIHSAKAAHDYCKELWRLMTFSGVSYGDLYHGNMRFDINISLAPFGAKKLGTRAEIKNLNSFRSVERAVEYEYQRQSALLDQGQPVIQETRGWSDATGKTTSQRSKEESQDYRYMPEPDIPPLDLDQNFIDQALSNFPLMPEDYRQRLGKLLASEQIEILLDYPELIKAIEAISQSSANSVKKLANLFTSVLLAEDCSHLLKMPLPRSELLVELIQLNQSGSLSSTATKELFILLFDSKIQVNSVKTLAESRNLIQENDSAALEAIIDQVLADPATAQAQADYRSGQTKVLGFLVGQVMKASRGSANPSATQQILVQKLQKDN